MPLKDLDEAVKKILEIEEIIKSLAKDKLITVENAQKIKDTFRESLEQAMLENWNPSPIRVFSVAYHFRKALEELKINISPIKTGKVDVEFDKGEMVTSQPLQPRQWVHTLIYLQSSLKGVMNCSNKVIGGQE